MPFKSPLAPHHKQMIKDGFPSALLLTPKERAELWRKTPPKPIVFEQIKKPEDPATVAFLNEQEAIRKAKARASLDKFKRKLEQKANPVDLSSMRWDPRRGKFVPDLGQRPAGTEPKEVKVKLASRGRGKGPADDLSARVAQLAADRGGFNPAKLKAFAQANGVWDDKYAGLNNGLQRMNVVNRLRNKAKKDPAFKVKW